MTEIWFVQQRYENIVREARIAKRALREQAEKEKKERAEVHRRLKIEQKALKREKEARIRAENEVIMLIFHKLRQYSST